MSLSSLAVNGKVGLLSYARPSTTTGMAASSTKSRHIPFLCSLHGVTHTTTVLPIDSRGGQRDRVSLGHSSSWGTLRHDPRGPDSNGPPLSNPQRYNPPFHSVHSDTIAYIHLSHDNWLTIRICTTTTTTLIPSASCQVLNHPSQSSRILAEVVPGTAFTMDGWCSQFHLVLQTLSIITTPPHNPACKHKTPVDQAISKFLPT